MFRDIPAVNWHSECLAPDAGRPRPSVSGRIESRFQGLPNPRKVTQCRHKLAVPDGQPPWAGEVVAEPCRGAAAEFFVVPGRIEGRPNAPRIPAG